MCEWAVKATMLFEQHNPGQTVIKENEGVNLSVLVGPPHTHTITRQTHFFL